MERSFRSTAMAGRVLAASSACCLIMGIPAVSPPSAAASDARSSLVNGANGTRRGTPDPGGFAPERLSSRPASRPTDARSSLRLILAGGTVVEWQHGLFTPGSRRPRRRPSPCPHPFSLNAWRGAAPEPRELIQSRLAPQPGGWSLALGARVVFNSDATTSPPRRAARPDACGSWSTDQPAEGTGHRSRSSGSPTVRPASDLINGRRWRTRRTVVRDRPTTGRPSPTPVRAGRNLGSTVPSHRDAGAVRPGSLGAHRTRSHPRRCGSGSSTNWVFNSSVLFTPALRHQDQQNRPTRTGASAPTPAPGPLGSVPVAYAPAQNHRCRAQERRRGQFVVPERLTGRNLHYGYHQAHVAELMSLNHRTRRPLPARLRPALGRDGSRADGCSSRGGEGPKVR